MSDSLDPLPSEQLPDGLTAPAVLYTVNSKQAGQINGTKYQILKAGQKSTAVTAEPNLGYRFVAWSDGVTTPPRLSDSFTEPTLLTAIFDYDRKELPILVINTEGGDAIASKTRYKNFDLGCRRRQIPFYR